MVRGSLADWAGLFLTNMRSSSAVTGDTRSVPQAAYYSYWGRAYRSGPGEIGTEDPRDSRETLWVGDIPSFFCIFRAHSVRIFITYLVLSLSFFFFYKAPFSPPAESGAILGQVPLQKRGQCLYRLGMPTRVKSWMGF